MTHASSANNAAGGRGPVTDSQRREVYTLVDALLGQRITEADARRLDELVCNDSRARRCYLDFITDSAMLRELGSAATGWHALKGRGELSEDVDPADTTPRPFKACHPTGLKGRGESAEDVEPPPRFLGARHLNGGSWHPMALLGPAPLAYDGRRTDAQRGGSGGLDVECAARRRACETTRRWTRGGRARPAAAALCRARPAAAALSRRRLSARLQTWPIAAGPIGPRLLPRGPTSTWGRSSPSAPGGWRSPIGPAPTPGSLFRRPSPTK